MGFYYVQKNILSLLSNQELEILERMMHDNINFYLFLHPDTNLDITIFNRKK